MNPQAARSWTRHTASERTAHVGYIRKLRLQDGMLLGAGRPICLQQLLAILLHLP